MSRVYLRAAGPGGMAPREPWGHLPSGSWDPGRQKGNAASGCLTSGWGLRAGVGGQPSPAMEGGVGAADSRSRFLSPLPIVSGTDAPLPLRPSPAVPLCPHLLTGQGHALRSTRLRGNQQFPPGRSDLHPPGGPAVRGLVAALGKAREPVSGFRCGTASALRGDPSSGLPQGHVPDMAGAGVRSPAGCFMLTGRRQAGPCWAQREGRKQS